jgi:hypothetical protein
MKTRIVVVGAAMLLSLGSAVAGSIIFAQGKGEGMASVAPVAQQELTAETIAMWKATASTSGYTAPRVPL